MNKAKILVVDDNSGIRAALQLLLPKYFKEVKAVASPNVINSQLREFMPDVILLDMNFQSSANTGNEGLYWLSEIKKTSPTTEVVLFTAYADISLAVEGMKRGAFDFIVKPWENEKLISVLDAAYKHRDAGTKKKSIKPAVSQTATMHWGSSPEMKNIFRTVNKIASTDASILITGENGTGKDVLAAEIHRLSDRGMKPMVCVDAGAITETLFESELFGHVKGAFTDAHTDRVGKIEQANGSTLFLDEIGNLSYEVQVQLLRALQERRVRPLGSDKEVEVDIRLVSATNENLQLAVQEGRFREDLFHRINEFTLRIPALSERVEDIPLFAEFFLDQANRELERNVVGFAPEVMRAFCNYSWPGNLRQMKNIVKRAALLAQNGLIRMENLGNELEAQSTVASPAAPVVTHDYVPAPLYDEQEEKRRIVNALQQTKNNKSRAAKLLGIDRKTLYNKLKLYGLGRYAEGASGE